jgi:serine/threonine-protein kinase
LAESQALVLPPDVVITPVADLPPDVRLRLEHEESDHCVTRPRTRTVSSVVDARTAALLGYFREPTTIVDAVLSFAAAEELDPRETLDEAFGALAALVEEDLLVPAESALAQPVAASLEAGEVVEDVEIVEPVHVLDDTEVYLGRTADGRDVALKIVGAAGVPQADAAIRHEARVLARLDGRVNPPLVHAGFLDERPFLVTGWQPGVELFRAATDARRLPGADAREELLDLAERIVEAYAHLHAQGVLHGDVQPRNVLVDGAGGVTIVDYGLAAIPDEGVDYMRGGVDDFHAPESARIRLAGGELPPPSAAAEQYGVAALVYFVLAGAHTHAFSLQQDEMLRQVLEDPPLPFGRHGVTSLPAVERCLQRALAKDPADRYPAVADLLADYRAAAARDRARPAGFVSRDGGAAAGRQLVADVLARIEAPGELFARGLQPPTASVTYGGAGIAYALLRLAQLRDDAGLLAQADLWAARAADAAATDEGRWNRELGIVPEVFGDASLFHHASGVHCVEALVAHARADDGGQVRAVERFVAAGDASEHVDLAFGRSGLLLGCATLLEALPPHLDGASLRSFGDTLLDRIAVDLGGHLPSLGIAHGRAGCLYAVLRWCDASGAPVPAGVEERLEELASLGRPAGRGLRWPRVGQGAVDESLLVASWCNGAAGHAQLWTCAERRWPDAGFDRLADAAAWTACDAPFEGPGDLCCGLAGRAYAVLARHRRTGERRWLARARVLAERAVARPAIPPHRLDSLYHGDVGLALLVAELEAPELARMPLFEPEGWPGG